MSQEPVSIEEFGSYTTRLYTDTYVRRIKRDFFFTVEVNDYIVYVEDPNSIPQHPSKSSSCSLCNDGSNEIYQVPYLHYPDGSIRSVNFLPCSTCGECVEDIKNVVRKHVKKSAPELCVEIL